LADSTGSIPVRDNNDQEHFKRKELIMGCWSEEYYARWSKDVQLKQCITDVLPESFDVADCCSRNYFAFEERVLAFLKGNQWKLIADFKTSDGDSFGPMVRLAKVQSPSGFVVELCHG
jgi:hypothetical protein